MTLYWTERERSRGRWTREDGWPTRAAAERAAQFYRNEHKRRARVVRVDVGAPSIPSCALAMGCLCAGHARGNAAAAACDTTE